MLQAGGGVPREVLADWASHLGVDLRTADVRSYRRVTRAQTAH